LMSLQLQAIHLPLPSDRCQSARIGRHVRNIAVLGRFRLWKNLSGGCPAAFDPHPELRLSCPTCRSRAR
jgi:hypothetical protein